MPRVRWAAVVATWIAAGTVALLAGAELAAVAVILVMLVQLILAGAYVEGQRRGPL